MDTHTSDVAVQKWACGALCNIGWSDRELQEAIVAAGGAEKVQRVIEGRGGARPVLVNTRVGRSSTPKAFESNEWFGQGTIISAERAGHKPATLSKVEAPFNGRVCGWACLGSI